jgi:hypothetical protein
MTPRPPDFDELIGTDVSQRERERLGRVHDLLIEAGPPPEISPELEAGPDMLVTYRFRPRKKGPRRTWILVAAALVVAAVFFGGFVTGRSSTSSDEFANARVVELHATAQAPKAAFASIGIGARDSGGNWPMRIVAQGLPRLGGKGYYEVFLTREGKIVAPCGTFKSTSRSAVAYLNAPYRLGPGTGWVVTAQKQGDKTPGAVVLTT